MLARGRRRRTHRYRRNLRAAEQFQRQRMIRAEFAQTGLVSLGIDRSDRTDVVEYIWAECVTHGRFDLLGGAVRAAADTDRECFHCASAALDATSALPAGDAFVVSSAVS